MKVKKYTASSMPEVMKIIKTELGNDAVILNSKVIHTGGFLGFFKKRSIEVLAAIDPSTNQRPKQMVKEKEKKPLQSITTMPKVDLNENIINEKWEKPNVELLNEISELKNILKHSLHFSKANGIVLPIPIQDIQTKFQKQDIDPILQEKIITSLIEKWYLKGANGTKEEVFRWAKDIILNDISSLPFGEISFEKKFVNVVGPTGVGKTTTLAKIAGECVLKYRKKIAFFTTDTYRIGAIEQLKTYANILNVPIEVCYSLDDFKNYSKKYKDEYDIIFVDTAGRNFRKQKYIEDLQKVIDYNNDMETYLVLSLTAKQSDMEEIYNQFSLLEIDKFIFTKLDETSTFGTMLNLMMKYKKGVAYLTTGQNVPDDMVAAKPEDIVNRIIGDE